MVTGEIRWDVSGMLDVPMFCEPALSLLPFGPTEIRSRADIQVLNLSTRIFCNEETNYA